jgi:mannose-6-phosphate isomerase-like protein (cupin superfamily)
VSQAGDLQGADLLGLEGTGPLWGMASADLNATLLGWPPDHELAEHQNLERDVLLIVLRGAGAAWIDNEKHVLSPGQALLIPKGTIRRIRAGGGGIRYLSVHLRRPRLEIERLPADAR